MVCEPVMIQPLGSKMVNDGPGGHPRLVQCAAGLYWPIVNGSLRDAPNEPFQD